MAKATTSDPGRAGRLREAPDGSLVTYFRDMTGTALLTPERAGEIAALAAGLTGAAPGRELAGLLGVANHLSGRSR